MITAAKINAVRKLLKSGLPQGEIHNDLLSEGYTNEEIGIIFFEASVKKREGRSSSRYDTHFLSIIGAALIITGIAIHSSQTWLQGYSTGSIITGTIFLGIGLYFSIVKKKNKQ